MKEKIEKVLAKILYKFEFLGPLVLTSEWVENNQTETFATDGKQYLYNKEFVKNLTEEELTGVILHEIFHNVFLHCDEIYKKLGQENIELWKISLEYVVNSAVIQLKSLSTLKIELPGEPYSLLSQKEPPENAYFYDKSLEDLTAPEIYEKLLEKYKNKKKDENKNEKKKSEKGGNQGKNEIFSGDDIIPRKIDQETLEKVKTTLEKIVEKGNLPGNLKRLIDNKIKELFKVPWKQVLLRFVGYYVKSGIDDYRWDRPNHRHYLSNEIVMPGLVENTLEDVIVVIDTSGSMGNDELEKIKNELSILAQYVEDVVVITTDTVIQERVKVKDLKKLKIDMKGGGGTDFNEVFDKVKKCLCMIFFTDGEAEYPKKPPKYPVLWVLTKRNLSVLPPFGKIVYQE